VPRATSYYSPKPYKPTTYNPNYHTSKDPNDYITEVIGNLPLNPKYLSNPTNGFAMNSYADAIFNMEAKKKKWEGTVLDPSNPLGWVLHHITPIGAFIDSVTVGWETIVNPVVGSIKMANADKTDDFDFWDGLTMGLGTSAYNTLVNFGNTLDIVANPVKGALIEGFSPTGDGFIKGFQRGLYGDSEYGRKQYDYADYVDNKLLAFGLELISDPLNVLSFGTKSLASGGTKVLTNVVDDVADVFVDVARLGVKEIVEEIPEAVVKNADELIDVTDGIAKSITVAATKDVAEETASLSPKTIFHYVFNNDAEEPVTAYVKNLLQEKTGKEFADEVIESFLHSVIKDGVVSEALVEQIRAASKKAIKRLVKQHISDPYKLLDNPKIHKSILGVKRPQGLPNDYGKYLSEILSQNKTLRAGAFGAFGKKVPPSAQALYASLVQDVTLKDLPSLAKLMPIYSATNYIDDTIRNFALAGTGILPAWKLGNKTFKYVRSALKNNHTRNLFKRAINDSIDWLMPNKVEHTVDFNSTAPIKEVELQGDFVAREHVTLPQAELKVVNTINEAVDKQTSRLLRNMDKVVAEDMTTNSLLNIYKNNLNKLNKLIAHTPYLTEKGVHTFEDYVNYFKNLRAADARSDAYLKRLEALLKRYKSKPTVIDLYAFKTIGESVLEQHRHGTVGDNLTAFLNDDVSFLKQGVEPWLQNTVKREAKDSVKEAVDESIATVEVYSKQIITLFSDYDTDTANPLRGVKKYFETIAEVYNANYAPYGSGKPEQLFLDDSLELCYLDIVRVLESIKPEEYASIVKKSFKDLHKPLQDRVKSLVDAYFDFLKQLSNNISFNHTDDALDPTQTFNRIGNALLNNNGAETGGSIAHAVYKSPQYSLAEARDILYGDTNNPIGLTSVLQKLKNDRGTSIYDLLHIEGKLSTEALDIIIGDWRSGKGRINDVLSTATDVDRDSINYLKTRLNALSEAVVDTEITRTISVHPVDAQQFFEELPLFEELPKYFTHYSDVVNIKEIIQHDIHSYVPMLSRASVLNDINSPEMSTLLSEWERPDGLVRQHLNAINAADQAKGTTVNGYIARNASEFFDRAIQYRNLDARLKKLFDVSHIDPDLSDAFLDAFLTRGVENTRMLTLDKIYSIIDECFDNGDMHIRSVTNGSKMSQDYTIRKICEELIADPHTDDNTLTIVKDLLKRAEHAHDAAADIQNWADAYLRLNTERLTELRKLCETTNSVAITYDTETTALKDYAMAEPFQLAAAVINPVDGTLIGKKLYRIKLPEGADLPSPTLLQKFFNSADAAEINALKVKLNTAEVEPSAWFRSVYVTCDHPFYLNGTWEPALLAEDAYASFFTDYIAPYDSVVFAGQNVQAYDMDLLIKDTKRCPTELTTVLKEAIDSNKVFDTYVLESNIITPVRFDNETRSLLTPEIVKIIERSGIADKVIKRPIIDSVYLKALNQLKVLASEVPIEIPKDTVDSNKFVSNIFEIDNANALKPIDFVECYTNYRNATIIGLYKFDTAIESDLINFKQAYKPVADGIYIQLIRKKGMGAKRLERIMDEALTYLSDTHNKGLTALNLKRNTYTEDLYEYYDALHQYYNNAFNAYTIFKDTTESDYARAEAVHSFVVSVLKYRNDIEEFVDTLHYDLINNANAHSVRALILNTQPELAITPLTVFKTFGELYDMYDLSVLRKELDSSLSLHTNSVINTSAKEAVRENILRELYESAITKFIDDFNMVHAFDGKNVVKKVSKAGYGPKQLTELYNRGEIDVPGWQNIVEVFTQNTARQGIAMFNFRKINSPIFADYFDPDFLAETYAKIHDPKKAYDIDGNLLNKVYNMANSISNIHANLYPSVVEKAFPDAQLILKTLSEDKAHYGSHCANLLYKNLYETDYYKASTVATAMYLHKHLKRIEDVDPELLKKAEAFTSYNTLHLHYTDAGAKNVATFKLATVDEFGHYTSWITGELGTYDELYEHCLKVEKNSLIQTELDYEDNHVFGLLNRARVNMHRILNDNLDWLRNFLKDRTATERTKILRQLNSMDDLRYRAALDNFLNRDNRVELFLREAPHTAYRKCLVSDNELDLSDFEEAGVSVRKLLYTTQKGTEYERVVHVYDMQVSPDLTTHLEALPDDWFDVKVITNTDFDKSIVAFSNDVLTHLGSVMRGVHYSNGAPLTENLVIALDNIRPVEFRKAPSIAELKTLKTTEFEYRWQGFHRVQKVKTENFFSTLRADNMIVAPIDVRRELFNPAEGVNLIRRYVHTMLTYIDKRMSDVTLLYNLIANSECSITSPLFDGLKASDFLEMWNTELKKDHVAVYITASKHTKSGMQVHTLDLINEKSVELAKDLNVCLIRDTEYCTLAQAINDFKLPAFFEAMREISAYYKIGYLSSIGFIIRNLLDSSYKNHVDFKESVSIPRQVIDLWSTMRLVHKYNTLCLRYGKTFDNMTEYRTFWHYITSSTEDFNKYISDSVKRKHYAEYILDRFAKDSNKTLLNENLIDPQLFNLMDLFIKNGPSAGLAKDLIDPTSKHFSQVLSRMPPVSCLMDMNGLIEQSVRLQHYFYDLQRGAGLNEAVTNIIKTHFDYSDKSLFMIYTEIVFPFMSFSFKNLQYWLEVVFESGVATTELVKLLKTLLNYNSLFTPDQEVYRNYDYSFDFENDILGFKSTQPWQLINAARLYHMLNGNVVWDTGKDVEHDNGFGVQDTDLYSVFKLSPSILDAVKMLYTPLSQFEQRMLPPYKVLLSTVEAVFTGEVTDLQKELSINGVLNNLPFVGAVLQRSGIGNSNNLKGRIEDAGLYQAVSSLFTAAYVPHKKYNTWYGADNEYLTKLPQYSYKKSSYYYSRSGGFKTNYGAGRLYGLYYNPNTSRYRLDTLARSPYYKSPYSPSKKYALKNTYYSSLTYNSLSENLLKKRVLDKHHYT
jgi:hypothetical protein